MTPHAATDPKALVRGWLGPILGAWQVVRIKHLARLYAGGTPDRDNRDYWDDGTIPWLNSGEVNQWVINKPSAFITEEAFRNSSAKWIPNDALVMALAGQGKTKGMVAQLGIESTCNQSMAAIVPARKANSRFLLWWRLSANYETIRNLAGGEQRDGLNLEIVGDIPCPNPALEVQRAIANYLDRETARLDALVAAKERVLGLLAEKRRALITRAVTRGLDPRAPLRDSGIPWLGEIPQHWTVKPLKFAITFQRGHDLPQQDRVEGDIAVVTSAGPSGWHNKAMAKPPGIVTGRYGTIGEFYLIEQDYWPLNTTLYSVDLHGNRPRFIWYMLHALVDLFLFNAAKSAVPGVDRNDLHPIPVAIPPAREQEEIVDHLDRRLGRQGTVQAATERTIALLKERRAALIAAAVTGQIDVQGNPARV